MFFIMRIMKFKRDVTQLRLANVMQALALNNCIVHDISTRVSPNLK